MKDIYLHSRNSMKDRRRYLRARATKQEKVLWDFLRSKRLGYKFQRQHSIGIYIMDFYCAAKKLIIEIDGIHHKENQEYDSERTLFLQDLGFIILRFSNYEINHSLNNVITIIKESLLFPPSLTERGSSSPVANRGK